ncbi:hypothetical protein KAT92_03955 [Candidatus Babeliales bacterium]|nr:hypothetical protein [Candidatus Babeliales bacterium]
MLSSLTQLCDLVSDVAITNAQELQIRFADVVDNHPVDVDPEYILKIFSFMNWTFAQGVWSNLKNTRLRRDLQIKLKDCIITKLAKQLAGSDSMEGIAARAVFMTDEFNSYVAQYMLHTQSVGYADSGTARLFALERIQEQLKINDYTMNDIVPILWSDEKLNSEVESVAIQVNNAALEQNEKGFFRRLFGR